MLLVQSVVHVYGNIFFRLNWFLMIHHVFCFVQDPSHLANMCFHLRRNYQNPYQVRMQLGLHIMAKVLIVIGGYICFDSQ